MKKHLILILLVLILSPKLWSQKKDQIDNSPPIINTAPQLNCYVYKNMQFPSFAEGIIRYHITFNINQDTIIKSMIIEDHYNIKSKEFEKSLSDLLSDTKWPIKFPKKLTLPGQIKYLLKIDLIQYQQNCPQD